MFTESKMTPAHREALEKVAQSFYGQLLRGIGEGRHDSKDSAGMGWGTFSVLV